MLFVCVAQVAVRKVRTGDDARYLYLWTKWRLRKVRTRVRDHSLLCLCGATPSHNMPDGTCPAQEFGLLHRVAHDIPMGCVGLLPRTTCAHKPFLFRNRPLHATPDKYSKRSSTGHVFVWGYPLAQDMALSTCQAPPQLCVTHDVAVNTNSRTARTDVPVHAYEPLQSA